MEIEKVEGRKEALEEVEGGSHQVSGEGHDHKSCWSCCRRKLEELQREDARSREEVELLQREVTTVYHLTPETLSEVSP